MKSIIPFIAAGVFALLQMTSFCLMAQGEEFRYGLGAAFGVRHGIASSDYSEIDGMDLVQEGGTIFLMTENRFLSSRLQGGFFFSGANVPHTTDLFEGGFNILLHPLHINRYYNGKLSPYLITGVTATRYNFYGFYAGGDSPGKNRSVGIEPYVGSVRSANWNAGVGIRLDLPMGWQFLQFFAEVYKMGEFSQTSSAKLAATTTTPRVAGNLGLAFGFYRLRQ